MSTQQQRGNLSLPSAELVVALADTEADPTQSAEKPLKMSLSTITYDSGNYSNASNMSDSAQEPEPQSNYVRFHHLLREKDQALFLALQDVRKLRSELERLSKSEQWYKQELKAQKSTRLEALERLYTQERKYMQENQRLQRECVRLYAKCGDMEHDLELQREKALEDLKTEARANKIDKCSTNDALNFELEQQRALINDQQQLITVLRKQKRALLEDLKHLTEEKDEKVLELQQALASMEAENTRMTTKCKELIYERTNLKEILSVKETMLEHESLEKFKLQTLVGDLKEQLCVQENLLIQKENEIIDLQDQFKIALEAETNADDVHRLSLAYKEEVHTKTLEIVALKRALLVLQEELKSLAEVQTQNEAQERMIEQLNFTLETRQYELDNLKQTDAAKSDQIAELQLNLESFRSEREAALEQLFITQNSMKKMEKELICLNEQYANMCALCESTKYELEIRQIEQSQLKYQTEGDKKDIEMLKEKLQIYLKQTAALSEKINELEAELERKTAEKLEMEGKLQCMEYTLRTENENSKKTESLLFESEADLKELQEKLEKKDEKLLELKAENLLLKQQENLIMNVKELLKEDKENYQSEFLTQPHNNEKAIEELRMKNESLIEDKQKSGEEVVSESLAKVVEIQQLKTVKTTNKTETTDVNLQTVLQNHTTQNQKLLEGKDQQATEQFSDDFEYSLERQTEYYATPPISPLESPQSHIKVNQEFVELQKNLLEKTKECELTAIQLEKESENMQKLRKKLLENDAQLYKLEKLQNAQKAEKESQIVENLAKLKLENKLLLTENNKGQANLQEFRNQLNEKEHLIADLLAKLNAAKYNIDQPTNNLPQCLDENTNREVLGLRAKVQELEAKLEFSLTVDNEKREERMRCINQLLSHQHGKVAQLNQSQAEWEEFLQALNNTQILEENIRKELELKRAELEELNELFAEQNEELQKLQELTLQREFKRHDEFAQLQAAFQKEINIMQESYKIIVDEHKMQQAVIEELKLENEKIQSDFNEEFADEVTENKKQVRNLQGKLEKLVRERDQCLIKMQELETEIYELKQTKRQKPLVMPSLFRTQEEQANLEYEMDQNASSSDEYSSTDERLKLLSKVLELEYRRKMKRHEMHIHTLLDNVKMLKRALKATELKATVLNQENGKISKELFELQMAKRHMEEMRLKYEQSQYTIRVLEQTLEIERKKYESSDMGKSAPTEETVHEMPNLIDDYKKLLHQSAATTGRPKTSAIIDLIQRSNQCVPNFEKLESSIEDLRNDMQKFIATCKAEREEGLYDFHTSRAANPEPTLMDELLEAEENLMNLN